MDQKDPLELIGGWWVSHDGFWRLAKDSLGPLTSHGENIGASWQWGFPLRTKHTIYDVSLTSILQIFSDEHPVVLLYSDSDKVRASVDDCASQLHAP